MSPEKGKYVQLVQGPKLKKRQKTLQVRRQSWESVCVSPRFRADTFMSDVGILIPSLQPEEWEPSWTKSGN